MSDYTPVIGLEVHVELKTKSKMFCQCSADYFGKEPNSNTCPVCLGLPGALPVPNRQAIEWCIKIGKALNCEISLHTKFDRKHYFYPDLPKGYQISQYDEPVAVRGFVPMGPVTRHQPDAIPSSNKTGAPSSGSPSRDTHRIIRVHMEEDTGKLTHNAEESLVDFNRSGVPLVEIVTEPDFDNSDDVKKFLEELHTIIRYLEVSDADMEKGSMRLEPNISVKKSTDKKLPDYKVEVKNINSFNFVKKAIDYEVKRHVELLEKGETPAQETRGYNEAKGITVSQRTKEEAHDYRYFPEPDIPPMVFEKKYIDSLEITELPRQKVNRYISELGIKETDAVILTRDKEKAQEFEQVVKQLKKKELNQQIANAIINKKLRGQELLDSLKPKETNLTLLSDAVKSILINNHEVVRSYKEGKENAIMFLVGQVMKELKGKADAQLVKKELEKNLKK